MVRSADKALYLSSLDEDSAIGLRYNLTLHRSTDQGASWSPVLVLRNGSSAYSSLVALPDPGSLAVLYEWSKALTIIFTPDAISFRALRV